MKSFLRKGLIVLSTAAVPAGMFAAPLPSSVRPAIPADVQQLICVDYRALKNSDTAQKLKEQVLPENLKQFETALKGIGVSTDRDLPGSFVFGAIALVPLVCLIPGVFAGDMTFWPRVVCALGVAVFGVLFACFSCELIRGCWHQFSSSLGEIPWLASTLSLN